MTADDQDETRAACARWFVEHDEVDEAARVLEPGDELELGRSDYLNLAAALARRGLAASYEGGRVSVRAGAPAGELVNGPRKPPARVGEGASPAASKKTA
jgi:hypothetical protein